ncbi:MAG: hypothetical protein ACK4N5_25725 [Myxococcales bacterium]
MLRITVTLAAALTLALLACGGGQDHCAQACDHLAACGIEKPLPFVCGQTDHDTCEHDARWHDCAHCVSDATCAELGAGACASECR